MPKWDLNVLLKFLDSRAFEPLEDASFKTKSQKSLVLVFLASGCRCVDLLNMSRVHY